MSETRPCTECIHLDPSDTEGPGETYCRADDTYVLATSTDPCPMFEAKGAEDPGRRQRAALAAVAGIPTEALERGALKHVIDLAAWPYEGEHGSRCEEHEEGCPDCEMVAALVAIGRLK